MYYLENRGYRFRIKDVTYYIKIKKAFRHEGLYCLSCTNRSSIFIFYNKLDIEPGKIANEYLGERKFSNWMNPLFQTKDQALRFLIYLDSKLKLSKPLDTNFRNLKFFLT